MNRLRRSWLVFSVALLIASLLRPMPSGGAQDSTKATVSALQTQAADLKTMVALQAEVAGLEAQLTPGAGLASPATGGAEILYQADWSSDIDGWAGSDNWGAANGMLLSSANQGGWKTYGILAPYDASPVTDYAVEAEIQFVRSLRNYCPGFGIIARYEEGGDGGIFGGNSTGIRAGIRDIREGGCGDGAHAFIASGDEIIEEKLFNPGTDWHTYRLEVQGNEVRLLVDNTLVLKTIDNRSLGGGYVGLFSAADTSVRSFKVIAL